MFLWKSSNGINFLYPTLPTALLIKLQETGNAVLQDQVFQHWHTAHLATADPPQNIRSFWKSKDLMCMVEIVSHGFYINNDT